MKQYIITIILALCLGSCGQHSKHWETLTQVESIKMKLYISYNYLKVTTIIPKSSLNYHSPCCSILQHLESMNQKRYYQLLYILLS